MSLTFVVFLKSGDSAFSSKMSLAPDFALFTALNINESDSKSKFANDMCLCNIVTRQAEVRPLL